ncbi:drug/metabolite transporter (DMT)-like permease [Cytobacillus purgationiresistens]|uniref:Drug/metabolite transporter (DMT)-like permease n=1 Tax=Cytobacillus purgationiresistens TaxID=863449 RepID=A0ABU0AIE0_9BACI|nr:drug/metabolite transporter (DMT)-like permease [Cytobacillus purgationiresistens]
MGSSGTVAQFLFHQQHFSPEWLVVIRLLTAGLILLSIAFKQDKKRVWKIWENRYDHISILLFGILGMLALQYTFFAAIHHGNAATATVLQYLSPALITLYLAIRGRKPPNKIESLTVLMAIAGTFLLVTQGNIHSLSISCWAFFWGLSSALALAFYTLYPQKILARWVSVLTIGWGMMIGGVCFSFIHPPWIMSGEWTTQAFMAVLFIIINGTVIPFYCYLESLQYLKASEVSIIGCAEPLSTAFLADI